MAPGNEHCMYCESGEGTDIDHHRPKSRFPLLSFAWTNYLLACANCNSNYKRAQFPVDADGQPLLLDPTVDDPHEHLALLPTTGEYRGTSPKGRTSIEVYGLKRHTLCEGRRNAWIALQELITGYARAQELDETQRADDLERAVRAYPFASILGRLIRLSEDKKARRLVHRDCRAALQRHPEIVSWIRPASDTENLVDSAV
jgi:hypothetical protein